MMGAVWMRLRAELRGRWRSWVGLALLAGLAGGLVTAAAAGARRTDTAYDRLLIASRAHDVFLYQYSEVGLSELDPNAVAALPEVSEAVRVSWNWLDAGGPPIAGAIPADARLGSRIDRSRIQEGRTARAANEATLSFAGAEEYGLGIGSRIPLLPAEEPGERPEFKQYRELFIKEGVPLELRVVGVQVGPGDLPPITLGSSVVVYGTPALYTAMSKIGALQSSVDSVAVRLRRGALDVPAFREGLRRLAGEDPQLNVIEQADITAGVRRAIGPLTTAMWLLAAILGLAAIFVLGQAITRNVALSSDDARTIAALGMTPAQLWAAAMGKSIAIGAASAAVTVIVAVGLSPLTPLGIARVAEPALGLRVDVPALGIGAAAIMAALVLFTAIPAWRAASAPRREARAGFSAARPSATATAFARAGAAAPIVAGTHLALTPGARTTALPVRSTVFGIALASAALTAALAVAASFDHLLSTPRLYGRTWDFQVTGYGVEGDFTATARRLSEDEGIAAISYGGIGDIEIGGRPVEAVALTSLRGDLYPTIVEGEPPRAEDEIALGQRTLRAIHAGIGDRIVVAIHGTPPRRMRIVGRTANPAITQGEFGETPLLDWETLRPILQEEDQGANTILVRFARGADSEAVKARIEDILIPPQEQGFVDLEDLTIPNETPEDVVNFGRVEDLPLVLSGALAALAAAVLAHMVTSSVRRRRRDLAILKTLGLGRGGIRAAVGWQATLLVLVALGAGIPAGVVGGRWAWAALADRVGVLPEPRVPVAALLLMVPAAILLANAVAALPGRSAARTQPALVLRAE